MRMASMMAMMIMVNDDILSYSTSKIFMKYSPFCCTVHAVQDHLCRNQLDLPTTFPKNFMSP